MGLYLSPFTSIRRGDCIVQPFALLARVPLLLDSGAAIFAIIINLHKNFYIHTIFTHCTPPLNFFSVFVNTKRRHITRNFAFLAPRVPSILNVFSMLCGFVFFVACYKIHEHHIFSPPPPSFLAT